VPDGGLERRRRRKYEVSREARKPAGKKG